MLYYVISVINGTPVYIVLNTNCVIDPMIPSLWPIIGGQGTSKLAISKWVVELDLV